MLFVATDLVTALIAGLATMAFFAGVAVRAEVFVAAALPPTTFAATALPDFAAVVLVAAVLITVTFALIVLVAAFAAGLAADALAVAGFLVTGVFTVTEAPGRAAFGDVAAATTALLDHIRKSDFSYTLAPGTYGRDAVDATSDPKQADWYSAGHELDDQAFADREQWLAESLGVD